MLQQGYRVLRALDEKASVHLAVGADGKKYVLKKLSEDSISIYERISNLAAHEELECVYELIEYEGGTAAVCEYIEGSTLSELLQSGTTFPLCDIKKLICQLCRAVEHLHRNNIIHRDVNPSNIMVGGDLSLKLTDYGIARSYSGCRDQDTTILGTEGYSAPEQYGFRETRYTADVYSVGVVLRTLLNSCADGSVAQEVRLRRIAAKCASFDPDKRYASAVAVRCAVQRSWYITPLIISCAAAGGVALAAAAVIMLCAGGDRIDSFGSSLPSETITEEAISSAADSSTIETTTEIAIATTTAATAATAATPAAPTASTAATAISTAITTTTTAATTASPAKTTAMTTAVTASAATTTAATEPIVFEGLEYLDILSLERSDMVEPNRIEVASVQDENGNYSDSFEYEFFDDPAVHGEWVYCNTWLINDVMLPATAEGIINREFQVEPTIIGVSVYDGGDADLFYRENNGEASPSKWTNGYFIVRTGDGIFAQRMFSSVIDDVEFLFMESKTSGDYVFRGEITCYYIFVRREDRAAQ